MLRLAMLALGICLCAVAVPACSTAADEGKVALDAGVSPGEGGDASMEAGDGASGMTGEQAGCGEIGGELTAFGALTAFGDCLRSSAGTADKEAALARFVDFIEARGGFPIVEAGQSTFIYLKRGSFDVEDDARDSAEDFEEGRRNAPIEVAGDFNGWTPGTEARCDEIWNGVFVCTLPISPSPKDRWRYKFRARDAAGAEVWFSDPLSRRFDYDDNGRISLVRGGEGQGHLERWRAFATELVEPRDLYIYLPPGYDLTDSRYPVLYVHDGNNLFDTRQPRSAGATWDVDGVEASELAAGRIRPHIVVGIPNSQARFDEYTHVEDRIDWEGREQILGGRGEAYARFVAEEVKPAVDGRYRTLPERDSTAILGSSLGGLISYYIAWKYPELFKCVGGMSGTFGWGYFLNNPRVIDLYAALGDLPAREQIYYLDAGGTYPGGGCSIEGAYDGLGDEELCDVDRMKALLESKGIDKYPEDADRFPLQPRDANIYHYWVPGAPHSESAWNARLHRVLRFFFPPDP